MIVLPNMKHVPDARPVRHFHPSWLYCRVHNQTNEPLFIYGPRHPSDETTLPTSLFVLPTGVRTPGGWDCKGILIPSDRAVLQAEDLIWGPVALKYRDMRRISVQLVGTHYHCARSNGIREVGGIDFAVPEMSYEQVLCLPRREATL